MKALAIGIAALVVAATAPLARAQQTAGETKRDDAKNKGETTLVQETKGINDWDQKTAEFDRIRTPDSPAFVLLGVSPTDIQRPGTPMGLATALSGFVSGGDAALPENLSLEVAPYWLYGHPALTAAKYEQGGLANLYRTFTLSLGTKKTDRDVTDTGVTTTHSDTEMALGVRTRLLATGPDRGRECRDKLDALKATATAVSAAAILPEHEVQELRHNHPQSFPEKYQQAQAAIQGLNALTEKLEAAAKALDPKCVDLNGSSHGFSADLAGALSWFFLDSIASTKNADLRSAAAWATAAYATEAFTGAVLARFTGRQLADEWQKLFDVGLRLIYKRDNFALSGEGIARLHAGGPALDSTYKLALAAEYKVTGTSWLTVTFGRTFDSGQGASLFSLANFNYAFGKPTIQ